VKRKYAQRRIIKWESRSKVDGKKPRTYASWSAMIYRCVKSQDPEKQKHYGSVTVCDRWLRSFDAFVEDMGERPEGMTLDRWPNRLGNYEPGNCRWATPKQQSNNHSGVVIIDIGDFTGSIEEWCQALKRNRKTVDTRLHRGWTPYRALFEPIHR
jgi:hypothetical protein